MWVLRSCSLIGAEPEAVSLIPAETGRLRPPRTGPARLHRRPPVLAASRWLTRPEPVGATPQTEAERQAEHQRLEDTETAESLATGKAQWHVRVELGSHHHAVMLARTLENEGRPVVRRWKFLIVGASNEDQARELAGQIRQEAPPDATVIAEQAGVGWPFMPS